MRKVVYKSCLCVLILGSGLFYYVDSWVLETSFFAILAIGFELLWRHIWFGIPVYRRHIIIFTILGLLSILRCIFLAKRSCVGCLIFFDFFGINIGLMVSSLPWLWSRRLRSFGWQRGIGLRKNPLAPLILVADPHWHESLIGLKEAQRAHPEADWLFLGDLFDIWVGIPGRYDGIEREFLTWVKNLRSHNIWVGLWLGNREFFLDYLSDQFDLIGEGIGGQLVNEGLCWEHGDLVNSADWRYRLWALISRSGIAWGLVRILPRHFVDHLINNLKRIIRSNGGGIKSLFPDKAFMEVTATYCGKTFITGHFHTHKVYNNGVSLPWSKYGKFMVWHNGKVKPLDSLTD